MSEASRLVSPAPQTGLPLAESHERRAKALRVMADLSFGVFRNERYADWPDSELLERVQLEWAGRDRDRMPRRVHGLQMIGDRAGVVDDVVEQLRAKVALNRQHVLEK